MKPAMCLLSMLTALLGAPAPAWAENPTNISFGCAPWDGQSLVIKVGAPDAVYEVTLWGAGLSALHSGERKSLHLKPDASSRDDGVGRQCGAGLAAGAQACRTEVMDVNFDRFDGQAGGTVAGTIIVNTLTVPFQGVIQDQQQPCG